ncbi:Peroxidase 27 [Linum perenne]
MDQVMSVAPSLSGPLLRMQFHDCFIRGCDASVLIDSTKNNQAEKDAIPNLSLRGTKGLRWEVETGRKDGRISIMNEALFGLIPPSANISFLISGFKAVGLSVKDLIYNFTGKGDVDPTLDSEYIPRLRAECKTASDETTVVEMDPGSFKTFDDGYFKLVAKRRALFQSDAAMMDNAETKAYVEKSLTVGSTFLKDFGESMVKMGRIGVLTGDAGEIRKVCYKINDL